MPIPIPKKFLPLIIAGISGLVAMFLINTYIQEQTETAKQRVLASQKNLVSVVVARQDIPAGSAITENMLKEETINKAMLQPRAAESADRVIGKVSIAPFTKGEQILLNKVTVSGQEISLSSKIPRGKRAITIPVDNISSVGGMIRPSDHVDVMGNVPVPAMSPDGKRTAQMTTMPLFQDVLVLAVGQEYTSVPVISGEKKEERKSLSTVITLALSPQEANLIAFIQEQQGKIRLILRSPEDTQVQPAVPASWETVLRMVMPQAFQEQAVKATEEIKTRKRKVEIIRGLQREERDLE